MLQPTPRDRARPRRVAALLLALVALAPAAPAQDAPRLPPGARPLPPGVTPPGVQAPQREALATPVERVYPEPVEPHVLARSLENAWSAPDPMMRLGMLAEVGRRGVPTRDCVVIVPDTASYIAAIAEWTPEALFPVLIDDGSDRARDDIARFNRAFRPARVVRWSASDAGPLEPGEVARRLVRAFDRVWSLPGEPETFVDAAAAADARVGAWRPFGVVLVDPSDPAWTAGLALSAGRFQPMLAVTAPGNPNAQLTHEQTLALADALHAQLDQTGLDWRARGDDVDAITIAANIPARCSAPDGSVRATTDRLGRLQDDAEMQMSADTRWAWSGQIIGSAPAAAYAAMCSLFLQPETAWYYDSYPDEEPWSNYDLTAAADRIRQSAQIRLAELVDDPSRPTREHWLARAAAPIDAGLIFVNSKGLVRNFELRSERLPVGDLPILNVPAAVYFVHSFAAQQPASGDTVAGTWFRRGAFALIASVDEPSLAGFVPSPTVAFQLGRLMPWGLAARYTTAPAWKVAVFGDPLFALGRWRPRIEGAPPALAGAEALDETLRAALAQRDIPQAVALLVLLGRDADAVRLARSDQAQDPRAPAPERSAAAAMAFFRQGFADDLLDAMRRMPDDRRTGERADALWLAARPELRRGDADWLPVLRSTIREHQFVQDAKDLAAEYDRLLGLGAARDLVLELRGRAGPEHVRREMEALLRNYGG